ncbi:MAG: hypothetical protein AAB562_03540 [Patescibacteria group bacterium]
MSDAKKLVPLDVQNSIRAAEKLQSVCLRDYAAGTEIWVTTRNSVYHLTLLDEPQPRAAGQFPFERLVMAEGGRHLPVSREMGILGSAWCSPGTPDGRIACGEFLVLASQAYELVVRTSVIQEVAVKPLVVSGTATH